MLPVTELPRGTYYLAFIVRSRHVTLCTTPPLNTPALTRLQRLYTSLSINSSYLLSYDGPLRSISQIKISHFSSANLTLLHAVQISHFTH